MNNEDRNEVVLVGTIDKLYDVSGKDKNGNDFRKCFFLMLTSRTSRTQTVIDKTDCVAWGSGADLIMSAFHNGDRAQCNGYIKTERYQKGGCWVVKTNVIITKIVKVEQIVQETKDVDPNQPSIDSYKSIKFGDAELPF